MNTELIFHSLGVVAVASPFLLLGILGLTLLLGFRFSEHVTAQLTQVAVACGLTASIAVLAMMLATGVRYVPIELGNWVTLKDEHFHFHLKFVFDRLSVPFTILCFTLCGTVGAFAKVYLHREPGYDRFFLYYAVFLLGMIVSSLAGTIETLFFGWELVGLSSAFLIAYFQDRTAPVQNGMRVWSVYRIADAAFLIAALMLHHLTGGGDFEGLTGVGVWPQGIAVIEPGPALVVGLLLLLAAAGKSGMVPFSGWLPRAMEGPTPSSAVFYGALSIHLGAYLLLRVSPLLEVSMPLRITVVICGVVSAVYGAMTSRVQTDVKSALAFASLTQLGIIVVEIGLGLYYIALIHIIGHALLRTLQLLRAPSLLQDYLNLENAIGDLLPNAQPKLIPLSDHGRWNGLYRLCFQRGYLDAVISRWFVRPFIRFFKWSQSMESRWATFLANEPSDSTGMSGDLPGSVPNNTTIQESH